MASRDPPEFAIPFATFRGTVDEHGDGRSRTESVGSASSHSRKPCDCLRERGLRGQGHHGAIACMLLIAPSEHRPERLVTGGIDGTVRVWHTGTGEQLACFVSRAVGGRRGSRRGSMTSLSSHCEVPKESTEPGVVCLGLVPGEPTLLSGSSDGTVYAWQYEHYEDAAGSSVTQFVQNMHGCVQSSMRIGEAASEPRAYLLGHPVAVVAIASVVLPTSRGAVSGDVSGVIKLWDLVHQSCLATLQLHDAAISCFLLAPRVDIFSAGKDGKIAWSRVLDGQLVPHRDVSDRLARTDRSPVCQMDLVSHLTWHDGNNRDTCFLELSEGSSGVRLWMCKQRAGGSSVDLLRIFWLPELDVPGSAATVVNVTLASASTVLWAADSAGRVCSWDVDTAELRSGYSKALNEPITCLAAYEPGAAVDNEVIVAFMQSGRGRVLTKTPDAMRAHTSQLRTMKSLDAHRAPVCHVLTGAWSVFSATCASDGLVCSWRLTGNLSNVFRAKEFRSTTWLEEIINWSYFFSDLVTLAWLAEAANSGDAFKSSVQPFFLMLPKEAARPIWLTTFAASVVFVLLCYSRKWWMKLYLGHQRRGLASAIWWFLYLYQLLIIVIAYAICLPYTCDITHEPEDCNSSENAIARVLAAVILAPLASYAVRLRGADADILFLGPECSWSSDRRYAAQFHFLLPTLSGRHFLRTCLALRFVMLLAQLVLPRIIPRMALVCYSSFLLFSVIVLLVIAVIWPPYVKPKALCLNTGLFCGVAALCSCSLGAVLSPQEAADVRLVGLLCATPASVLGHLLHSWALRRFPVLVPEACEDGGDWTGRWDQDRQWDDFGAEPNTYRLRDLSGAVV
mmetsp:Transcript_32341/g.83954  ORF Transcript_32341/g.83954 Transcript_32341/m.83954 type:complete len:847 (-) Transcript_32341:6-2546(-)